MVWLITLICLKKGYSQKQPENAINNQADRRKFRSQTSDNMERWKSRGRNSQGGEDKRWRKSKMEKVRRKKMQLREKVGKLPFTVFFEWFVAPEGQKVTSLKRRVRSRTTFGSWAVEKVHAVVVRSTFPSQNVQNTPAPDHFWKLSCRKNARRCGAKHISKSKCTKHTSSVEKVTPLWC